MRYRDYFTIGSSGSFPKNSLNNTYLSSTLEQYLFYENQAFPNPSYQGNTLNVLDVDSEGNINYLGVFSSYNILIEIESLQLTNVSDSISYVDFYLQTPADTSVKIPLMLNIQIPTNSTVFLDKKDMDIVLKPYYILANTGNGQESGYGITAIASSANSIFLTGQAKYVRESAISE